MDFTLWKASKPGEPSWDSPWGKGRPGWHIECSAISLKYLGNTLDIHGGGQDLIFPHHENEIAQSESFTGIKPVVRYWLHKRLLQLGEEKMSKSLGNLITIKQALEKFSPDGIRIFVLSSHYRSPLTYSEAALAAAERGADRLRHTANTELDDAEQTYEHIFGAEPHRHQFIEAMDDDFNTAQAVATLFDLAREINRASETSHSVVPAQKVLLELAGVLGLTLTIPKELEEPPLEAEPVINLKTSIIAITRKANLDKLISSIGVALNNSDIDPEDIKGHISWMVNIREILRKNNRFQLADEIRAKLGKLGILLEDTSKGTVWKYKR